MSCGESFLSFDFVILFMAKKYVQHLAEFYFKPKYNWSVEQALQMFDNSINSLNDKIHYSDCIKGMKALPADSVNLVIADPPFGIRFSGKEHYYNRDEKLVAADYQEITSNYQQFSLDWINQLPRLMKSDASAYIFSGYNNLSFVLDAITAAGLKLLNHIIWHYQFGVFTSTKFVTGHYHLLFVVKDPKKYFYNRIEHYVDDVWEIKRKYAKGEVKNGTKLPEELVQRCIDYSSRPGDLVLDPFLGNGTTAVVARKNYRHHLGFEINKKMKNIILNNVSSAKVGINYLPYADRLKTPEQLAENPEYARAYKIYISNPV
jgi:site-specific DNA-methyltransferase (adenine-specific)